MKVFKSIVSWMREDVGLKNCEMILAISIGVYLSLILGLIKFTT